METSFGFINKILPIDLVDGPGNRLGIFFQGCNFNCVYCHNPETINFCQECEPPPCKLGCPKENKESLICIDCNSCGSSCPNKSNPRYQKMSLSDIEKVIERYRPFISGITISGGEPTFQFQFLLNLVKKIKELKINILLDSNGSCLPLQMSELSSFIDEAMIDLKCFSPDLHREITGSTNDNTIINIKNLARLNKLKEVRTVLTKAVLQNGQELENISHFISELPNKITWKKIPERRF